MFQMFSKPPSVFTGQPINKVTLIVQCLPESVLGKIHNIQRNLFDWSQVVRFPNTLTLGKANEAGNLTRSQVTWGLLYTFICLSIMFMRL